MNEYLLLIELSKTEKLWFYDTTDELHEGFLDGIIFKPYSGWIVQMHYKPRNETKRVYTARIWEYPLAEYKKKFAINKEDLK